MMPLPEFTIGNGLNERLVALKQGDLRQVELHVPVGREEDLSELHMVVISAIQEVVPHALITARFEEAQAAAADETTQQMLVLKIMAFEADPPTLKAG